MTTRKLFFRQLQNALWGTAIEPPLEQLQHEQYAMFMLLGQEQTVMGLLAKLLIDNNIRLEQDDVFDVLELVQAIEQQNRELDHATVKICRMMADKDIRIIVVKGQTLAPLYKNPALRQCGDVDFLCHPDDFRNAVKCHQLDREIQTGCMVCRSSVVFNRRKGDFADSIAGIT